MTKKQQYADQIGRFDGYLGFPGYGAALADRIEALMVVDITEARAFVDEMLEWDRCPTAPEIRSHIARKKAQTRKRRDDCPNCLGMGMRYVGPNAVAPCECRRGA